MEWTVPEEGCKVDTDGLWIPKGLPANEEFWAKEFVNYALSEPAQKAWCGALGLPPVRPGIEPPADLVGDPSYPTKPEDFDKLVSRALAGSGGEPADLVRQVQRDLPGLTGGRRRSMRVRWALLDGSSGRRACLAGPRSGARWRGRFLAPALVLVGILVIGLGQMLETSLHELDLATYRLGEEYTLANYDTALERPVDVARPRPHVGRGRASSPLATLLLAFPYAYLLVRTPSPWARKAILVALFLPFFIGQVVRAYGWLIILGREGLDERPLPRDRPSGAGFPVRVPDRALRPGAVHAAVRGAPGRAGDLRRSVRRWSSPPKSLGARWPSTFRHVVLPMAAPGLIGAAVVVFTLTLTDFAMPEILGGGGQDFFASAIYDSFFQISNAGLGAALSIVLTLIGSVIVAAVFMAAGTGTLGFRGVK